MKTIKVYEYKSGEPLGSGYLSDEKYAEYEASLERNPSGAVRLSEWMDAEARENVTAQDNTTVYFEAVELRSAE